MTAKQALAELRRRFGWKKPIVERGFIRKHNSPYCWTKHSRECSGFHWRCLVGIEALGAFFEVKGEGETWELAIADAQRREEEDRARWLTLKAGVAAGASR